MTLPVHMQTALGWLGIREVRGRRHNRTVVEWLTSVKRWATRDEVPWCAAFVDAVLRAAGKCGTGSLRARSYETWGVESDGRFGDVVVLSRGRNPRKGHVGFVVGKSSRHVYVLGGNQGNEVSIRRYPIRRVVTYRRPRGGW